MLGFAQWRQPPRRTNRSPVASDNGLPARILRHRRLGTWQYPRDEHGEANAVHYMPDTEKRGVISFLFVQPFQAPIGKGIGGKKSLGGL